MDNRNPYNMLICPSGHWGFEHSSPVSLQFVVVAPLPHPSREVDWKVTSAPKLRASSLGTSTKSDLILFLA